MNHWTLRSGRAGTLVVGLALVGMVPCDSARASDALAKKYACAACHQPDRKMVGPAWNDIATKYGDGSVTVVRLAASIRKGGAGQWGSMAMPPQSHVPDADLQALAAWVLGGAK